MNGVMSQFGNPPPPSLPSSPTISRTGSSSAFKPAAIGQGMPFVGDLLHLKVTVGLVVQIFSFFCCEAAAERIHIQLLGDPLDTIWGFSYPPSLKHLLVLSRE